MASQASLRLLLRQCSVSSTNSSSMSVKTVAPAAAATAVLRAFSSGPSPARLRRPFRLQSPQQQRDDPGIGSGNPQLFRKNTVTLFPGDFSDDHSDDPFDDDSDDDIFTNSAAQVDEADVLLQDIERREARDKADRARWIRNSVAPVHVSKIDERGRAYGRGGRKAASARVWIQPGFGNVVVNRQEFTRYFDRQTDRELVLEPLVGTETCGAFDVQVMVQGGGLTGQAGAVRHGLANALNAYNPDKYRALLKALGLLERDARKVERKKIGHVKARKSPQWVRR